MQLYNGTETMPLPMTSIERKTIPVACPWCNRIFGVAKLEIEGSRKIGPVHKICRSCYEFVNQGALMQDKS